MYFCDCKPCFLAVLLKKMDSGLPPTWCVYASRPFPGPSSPSSGYIPSSGFTHYQLFTLTIYFLPELCNMFLLVSLLLLLLFVADSMKKRTLRLCEFYKGAFSDKALYIAVLPERIHGVVCLTLHAR